MAFRYRERFGLSWSEWEAEPVYVRNINLAIMGMEAEMHARQRDGASRDPGVVSIPRG